MTDVRQPLHPNLSRARESEGFATTHDIACNEPVFRYTAECPVGLKWPKFTLRLLHQQSRIRLSATIADSQCKHCHWC